MATCVPTSFIPLAEETGLIAPLTEWVVRRVLLEQQTLLERDPELRLSINCASSLLVSKELEEILQRVVPPDLAPSLVLEVTESVFLGQDAELARETMSRLRRTGFRFALDDFGAGYSSLSYLQKLDFEFLKIDRSFVQAIGSGASTTVIFDTLVDLAHKLDLVTVAEGVETEEQRCYVDSPRHRSGAGLAVRDADAGRRVRELPVDGADPRPRCSDAAPGLRHRRWRSDRPAHRSWRRNRTSHPERSAYARPHQSTPEGAPMIDLYTWPTPNGHKIHIMLEECGLPYNVIPIDIGAGDQFKPEFLEISPNNKMPAMVDPDGPDGAPLAMFESGAILIYLAEKTGRFLPHRCRAGAMPPCSG